MPVPAAPAGLRYARYSEPHRHYGSDRPGQATLVTATPDPDLTAPWRLASEEITDPTQFRISRAASDGVCDEQPAHVVRLDPFWLADEPVNWTAYCALMGWQAPPAGYPQDPVPAGKDADRAERFFFSEGNKTRLQYCENLTTRAVDWHAHAAVYGNDERMLRHFGQLPREDPGVTVLVICTSSG